MRSLDDERIAHIVKLLERQYRRFLEHELKPHGVMFGHWEILRILREEEGFSQIELADRADSPRGISKNGSQRVH